jgi:two-component system sensor histidine kinase KdpD
MTVVVMPGGTSRIEEAYHFRMDIRPRPSRSETAGAVLTLAATAIATAAMAPWQHQIGLLNEGLILLLLTLLVSATFGWRVGLLAAFVTNLTLNFFFVEPLHRITVQEPEHIAALVVFLTVSVVGGSLLSRTRRAAETAELRQSETQVLLRLSRTMIGQTSADEALAALCTEVVSAFRAPGAAVVSRRGGVWHVLASAGDDDASRPVDQQERALAEDAMTGSGARSLGFTGLQQGRRVRIVRASGPERFTQPSRGAAFVPLKIGDRVLGILRLDGPIGATPFRDHPEHLLEAFASEAALAVQRVELVQAAAHTDALKQADELKTALMTSISHDLKTPLAGIKTSVSSLLDETVDWSEEDKRAFLETIDSQADRLDRVISDILDLNRIESGTMSPSLQPVHARALLLDARDATRMATSGRRVDVTAADDVFVEADEAMMRQALVNLVENAAKYSTPGGAIRLIADQNSGHAELRVEDDGPGIDARDLPHVFDRFFRAPERRHAAKGSGLGLAIVKGFVQLSGGTVRAESSPAGTRFIIQLPVAVRAKASA